MLNEERYAKKQLVGMGLVLAACLLILLVWAFLVRQESGLDPYTLWGDKPMPHELEQTGEP